MSRLPVPLAPWRAALVSHLEAMDSPTFVLSSLHHELDDAATASTAQWKGETAAYSPRARTVVYRGMWAGLTSNPRNPAPRNPNTYQTDLLTITTDVRMEKVSEMFTGPRAFASPPETLASCAGGPVEGVIWAAHATTQWRIRGRVYMVGPDINSDAAQPVRQALEPYMRRQHAGNIQAGAEANTWEWARELTAHFGNLSPVMRGSFRNPPPGTPISQPPGPGLGLGQKVENLHDEVARRNFRVLVIVPEQVDQVDLSDPDRGRRWRYDLVTTGNEATWTITELWP
ncbi:hypothetical protein V2A60_003063 [Cordyceps javanica]|uniref:FMN-binding split barrel-related protein n=1 Tax=Cordyceps javanica TaxID=43265 RepID=A0A545V4A5_9HYPO|nr:FMN-binding split barrel-related protein [Cordyceps javanica]TQW07829.1 FMN-binding split barrel-related protein [Cordyceps javanica]